MSKRLDQLLAAKSKVAQKKHSAQQEEKRIDQQIKVTRLMVRDHPLKDIEEPMLRKYMRQYLSMMMMICSAFLTGGGEFFKKRLTDVV